MIYRKINRFFLECASRVRNLVAQSKHKIGFIQTSKSVRGINFGLVRRIFHWKTTKRKIVVITIIFLLLTLTAQSLLPNLAEAASNSWTFADPSKYTVGSGISTSSGNATLSDPGSTTGSSLNLNPRAGTKSDGAAQFTAANKDYLTIQSNASLQTGDIDFEVGGWFYADTLGDTRTIISKGTADGSATEYSLFYSSSASNFKFNIGSSAVIAAGTVNTSTWYFVRGWHDSATNTVNISVDNGATVSSADTVVSVDDAAVTLGSDSAPQNFMDGRIDSAYFKKSITSADDATKLYNSGAGASYSQLTSLQLTAFQSGLTSWWDLDEESGTRYDAVVASGNNLTSTATQLIAPPVYSATELIQNPGYENAGTGGDDVYSNWSEVKNDGTVADTVTEGEFHSGSHATKLTAGVSNSTYIISENFAVTAGQSYALNFWTRGDGTNSGKYGIYDVTNAAYIGDASTNPGITGITYALVSTTFAAPAGCTTIRIYLRSLVNGGSVYFDDVSVKQITTIEKLNGGFETAGDGGADAFGSWTESASGTSTLNNETTSPYSGSHAVRFDIDASGSQVYVAQGVLTAGKKYKYTFYGKGTDTSTTVLVGGLDGSSTTMNSHTLTTSYAQYSGYFTASTINFFFKRGTAISKSIWADDITLESVGPLSGAGIATGVSVDGNYAAQFNGTTQYLNITNAASNGTLQGGSNSFEIGGWFYVDNFPQNSGGAYSTIFSKGTAGSAGGEYSYLVYPDGHMHLRARLGDNSSSAIDDGVSVPAGTIKQGNWYNFRVYYDATAGRMYQSINNQVYGSGLAVSGGVYAGTNDFRTKYSSQYFAGKLDGLYKINRMLTTQESTALYNGGKGLKYTQLPDSIKNDSNLKAFWDLDEKTGTRYDSTSNHNDLTDGGTVTQGYGVNYFGGAVSQINDISGNNKNFTQTTQSKRPVYSPSGINSKPALQFDGVDDALVKTGDQIGVGDITVTTVINPRGWGGGSNGRIIDNGKLRFIVSNSGRVQIASDASTYAVGATSSIALGTAYVVTATRTSSGVTNLYVNGTLSGTANQTSGTPSAGSDTYFGNISTFDRAFDGWIGTTQIYNSVLSDSQRNQIEKTLGNVYGITIASTTGTAATSIFPNISTNSPLRYTALQTFAETLGTGSTGTLRYQLSNDSAANDIASAAWYYYNGSAWVEADENNAWQSNTAAEINTNLATFASSVTPAHSLKWRTFFITDGVDNPILQSVDMTYISDTEAPNNPTLASAKNVLNGSAELATGNWYNYVAPSFTWNEPADSSTVEYEQSSGLAGYLVYFGADNAANITLLNSTVTTGVDNGNYKWQTGTTYTNAQTLTTNTTYYLKVIAVDNAGNAHYSADSSQYNMFTYKYDSIAPTAPLYVSVTPSGYSRTNNFTFNWPVGGVSGASDTGGSGLAKYQYKVGSETTWHDVVGNETAASVTLTDAASSGLNIFYLQAVDNAGSVSTSVRTNFYFNNTAPNAPANLIADPSSSSTNSFGFSWDDSPGEIAGYYYSVNAVPTLQNANFTSSTGLADGPYATQQGQNILYVVAKDNAGNYDFSGCSQASLNYNSNTDTCAAVAFTAETTAPGVPGGLQAFDSSTRNTQKYLVTLSWSQPTSTGAGFDGYDVYRSTDGVQYDKIGSTSSTAYADNGLESQLYFYYVVAKDNAGKFSALTTPVSITPTGKFTTPPVLVSGPTITVNPTSLVVKWVTDRDASSFVSIKNGNTFVSEQGENNQTTSHEVKVVGLKAQNSYTFNLRSTDIDGNSLVGADQEFKTANTPSVYDLTISNITQTSAIINFKSTAIANFTLYYGESANYGNVVPEDSSSSTTNHSLAISDLKPGLMYYFRVRGDDMDGNELRSENSFTTLPMPAISKFAIQPDKDAASTTLKVSWETNVPTTSTLKYAVDGVTFKEQSASDLVTSHEIAINDLQDQSKYTIYAAGRDQFGNMAESGRTTFDTPNDTRPPKISDVVIESSNVGNTNTSKAQVAVSWKTDESSNSQIEYGEGISGDEYTNKTLLDGTFTSHHLVIISDLDPSKPYHIRVVTADMAGNETKSGDNTVITGDVSKSALQLILNTLQNVFGWMGKLIK